MHNEIYATDAEVKDAGFRIRVGQVYGNVGIYHKRRKVMVLASELDARYYIKNRLDFLNNQLQSMGLL